jgi:hypothetical protein
MSDRDFGILFGTAGALASFFCAWVAYSSHNTGFAIAFSVIVFFPMVVVLAHLFDNKPTNKGDHE